MSKTRKDSIVLVEADPELHDSVLDDSSLEKFSEYLTSTIITIIVGCDEAQRTYLLHSDLVVRESEFIKNALSSNSSEALDATLRFPELDSRLFGYFVEYLYRDHGYLSRPFQESPEYIKLARLYTLGEKLQAEKFKNAIYRKMFHNWAGIPNQQTICDLLTVVCVEVPNYDSNDVLRRRIFRFAAKKQKKLRTFEPFKELHMLDPSIVHHIFFLGNDTSAAVDGLANLRRFKDESLLGDIEYLPPVYVIEPANESFTSPSRPGALSGKLVRQSLMKEAYKQSPPSPQSDDSRLSVPDPPGTNLSSAWGSWANWGSGVDNSKKDGQAGEPNQSESALPQEPALDVSSAIDDTPNASKKSKSKKKAKANESAPAAERMVGPETPQQLRAEARTPKQLGGLEQERTMAEQKAKDKEEKAKTKAQKAKGKAATQPSEQASEPEALKKKSTEVSSAAVEHPPSAVVPELLQTPEPCQDPDPLRELESVQNSDSKSKKSGGASSAAIEHPSPAPESEPLSGLESTKHPQPAHEPELLPNTEPRKKKSKKSSSAIIEPASTSEPAADLVKSASITESNTKDKNSSDVLEQPELEPNLTKGPERTAAENDEVSKSSKTTKKGKKAKDVSQSPPAETAQPEPSQLPEPEPEKETQKPKKVPSANVETYSPPPKPELEQPQEPVQPPLPEPKPLTKAEKPKKALNATVEPGSPPPERAESSKSSTKKRDPSAKLPEGPWNFAEMFERQRKEGMFGLIPQLPMQHPNIPDFSGVKDDFISFGALNQQNKSKEKASDASQQPPTTANAPSGPGTENEKSAAPANNKVNSPPLDTAHDIPAERDHQNIVVPSDHGGLGEKWALESKGPKKTWRERKKKAKEDQANRRKEREDEDMKKKEQEHEEKRKKEEELEAAQDISSGWIDPSNDAGPQGTEASIAKKKKKKKGAKKGEAAKLAAPVIPEPVSVTTFEDVSWVNNKPEPNLDFGDDKMGAAGDLSFGTWGETNFDSGWGHSWSFGTKENNEKNDDFSGKQAKEKTHGSSREANNGWETSWGFGNEENDQQKDEPRGSLTKDKVHGNSFDLTFGDAGVISSDGQREDGGRPANKPIGRVWASKWHDTTPSDRKKKKKGKKTNPAPPIENRAPQESVGDYGFQRA